ncbi:MAG: hypothetical protein U9Q04_06780 [Campylobacterota bacterium]|nr:hypothetical protein [Campylobacterota bacterium]
MYGFIRRRLWSQKGAMDKILVTLLFVVIGVAAVVGLKSWEETQANTMKTTTQNSINSVLGE